MALSSYFLHLYTTQIDDGAPVCFDGYVRDDKDARATCMRLAKARCFCCWQEAARFEMMVLWHGVGEEGEREERGGEEGVTEEGAEEEGEEEELAEKKGAEEERAEEEELVIPAPPQRH